MSQVKRLIQLLQFFWKQYLFDSLFALGSTFFLTSLISLFHLYPQIPDISFAYLLVILALAGWRGLYPALLASVVAFLSFDFFFVSPVYSFLINKFDDILTLIVFLITGIITSRLASALRRRAEQAHQREQETRALYELVQATTQENVKMKVLQQTDTLRAALLSSVSHDLRTPLSTIKASATSLLEKEIHWDEDARQSFVRAIVRETDRLNSLVENLLDMSRIEAGELRLEKVWYPLDELILDILDRMRSQLQGRDVQTHIPASLTPVEMDYVLIDQVVTNLVENAIHHTPANSSIDVSIELQEKNVQVCVADRGPGISPDEQEHIFDKFYRMLNQTSTSHRRRSGLGLSICRGLVEAHAGKIWVEQRAGGGACFCFTLPLTSIFQYPPFFQYS
jgi:two-component system sensor histidine kinase KdpD